MSLPVFLAEDVSGAVLVLDGPEGHHAARVRRLRVGEVVDVVDGRGTRARCTVTVVGREVVEVSVDARSAEPAPAPRLVLVQALAKGERGELAVELATELGVDEIVPWAAARSVVKWEGQRGEKALARWRSTAREAGKQSRRAWLPVVSDLHPTAQVLERVRSAATAFVLHELATEPLAGRTVPEAGDVLLVVGPEGGLTDDELELLTSAGGVAVRLGASVLRTSSAGAAAIAVVSAQGARWR